MNAPLRILHTESSKHLGGQEMRILLEMEGLRAHGIESWLAARAGTPILVEAQKRGLRTLALPLYNRLDPISMGKLWRLMRRECIDIINAHGSRDAWNAFLVARLLGIRTVRTRHVANPIRRHRIGQMIYGALADCVVTTGESIRAGLIAAGIAANKIVSVPTGVDVARFANVHRSGALRRAFGIPPEAPLIGMITLLRGEKGPDIFLKACDRLLDVRKNIWCALIGDGWMRPQLEQLLATLTNRRQIIMTGFRQDIPEVLAELDLSVLATRVPEGVPQAILQSHAARVPVVATAVSGIGEVAQEGVSAFTAPPGDFVALAQTIGRALDDPERCRLQAERGHALVIQTYSLDAMLTKMADIYHALGKVRHS